MVRETSKVVSGPIVKNLLIQGAEELALGVGTTLGPFGGNVAITKIFNVPHITKDGATVASEVKLEDSIKNVASETIKESAKQTAILAGDGTSSTIIFATSLFQELNKSKSVFPISKIKRQIEMLKNDSVTIARKLSFGISTAEDMYNIALVASNDDEEMSRLVTDAFSTIGVNGIVTVSETKSYKTFIDTTNGIKLDRSHISTSLIKSNKEVFEECNILVTDMKITSSNEALTILKLIDDTSKPLLVICEDLEGEALPIITYNKITRNVPIAVVRAPFIAEARKEALKDLALATGATFISKEIGWEFNSINPSNLGSSDSVTISLKETNIIGRKGKKELIDERINFYNQKIEEDYEGLKSNYKKRLAYLNGGAAIIYISGVNEIEVQEKKDRLDDTIRAVRAALEEGVVKGAGKTYIEIAEKLKSDKYEPELFNIFKKALHSIFNKIVENYGGTEDEFNETISSLVIDPTLVITSVLENGTSAALILSSIKAVIQKNEDDGGNN